MKLKTSNYLSNKFSRELYNIIDVDSVSDEVIDLIDKVIDEVLNIFCFYCNIRTPTVEKMSGYYSVEFHNLLIECVPNAQNRNRLIDAVDAEIESHLISQCTETCDLYRMYRQ